jgi:hypothetical protein
MARRFHIANGASVLQDNTDTINYEYLWAVPRVLGGAAAERKNADF